MISLWLKQPSKKLFYKVRGPYQIIHTTGHGIYFVRKLNMPNSPELKFMAYDLYLLLPSLKPCETVDTTYTQYMDQSHAPIINSLKKALRIELYNTKWFDKSLKTSIPSFIYKHDTLKQLTEYNSPFPSVFELHDETNTCPPKPLFEIVYYNISTSPQLTFHKSLVTTYCLFLFSILRRTLSNFDSSLFKWTTLKQRY